MKAPHPFIVQANSQNCTIDIARSYESSCKYFTTAYAFKWNDRFGFTENVGEERQPVLWNLIKGQYGELQFYI